MLLSILCKLYERTSLCTLLKPLVSIYNLTIKDADLQFNIDMNQIGEYAIPSKGLLFSFLSATVCFKTANKSPAI